MLPNLTHICLRMLMASVILMLASGCADSKELSRSRAAELIKNAKEFKEPATIVLKDDYGEVSVSARSNDEKEIEAQPRHRGISG